LIFLRWTLILSISLMGCGQSGIEDNPDEKPKRVKKDRGEASMMLGDLAWRAERAKAYIEGSELTIKASRTDGSYSSTFVRQQLTLNIKNFDAEGQYEAEKASMGLSNFTVVGLDGGSASEAEIDKAAMETLMDAKFTLLDGATVTVSAMDDHEVKGHFSHETSDPSVTKGTFRAVIKQDE